MGTTPLYVQFLITGLQASIWICLLFSTFVGVEWIYRVLQSNLYEWQLFLAPIFLSIIYVVGIVVDRLSDLLFTPWSNRLKTLMIPNPPRPISVMRFQIGKDSEALNGQLEYTRSRMRVVRATSVNVALITLFAILLVTRTTSIVDVALRRSAALSIFVIGVLFLVTLLYTYYKLMKTTLFLIREHYKLVAVDQNN